MKKSFVKFMMLLAVALPAYLLSSCSDDDEPKNEEHPNTIKSEDLKIDGEEFVRNNWLLHDENGNVCGLAVGTAFDESEPTVAYVGVEDMNEALFHFRTSVAPLNARCKLVNNNYEAVLVDTLGNVQNTLDFTKVDNGRVLATVKLRKKIGIEDRITEIRYIPSNLWPENANTDELPFQMGRMYRNDKIPRNYICVCVPKNGQEGLLVASCNECRHIGMGFQWETERNMCNFPNLTTAIRIAKELNSTISGTQLWQGLCATAGQTNLKEFKKREYWTSSVTGSETAVINLSDPNNYKMVQPDFERTFLFIFTSGTNTKYWILEAYKFYVDDYGDVKMRKANNNIWMDKTDHAYPPVEDFYLNENIEKVAQSIKIQ